ncbi:MAG: hypothetical protein KDB88_00070, partial [Flavobacteriales bacterium]|nr:hypothetical protein [Flavobacteriales bacterium]
RVNALAFIGDSIYAATDVGLFAAWRNEPNLAAFVNWRKRPDIPNPNGPFNGVEGLGGKLLVNLHRPNDPDNDTLYVHDGQWGRLEQVYARRNKKLFVTPDGSSLMIAQRNAAVRFNDQLVQTLDCYSYQGDEMAPAMAIDSDDGRIWIADERSGLGLHSGGDQGSTIFPSGPTTVSAYRMDARQGGLYVTTGSVEGNWASSFKKEGVHRFLDNDWFTVDRTNSDLMDSGANDFGGTVNDFLGVAVDPEDADHAFVGCWEEGLLELRGGDLINIFNTSNSSLQGNAGGGVNDVVQVAGVDFDEEGNLWMTNSNCPDPIAVRTASGSWRSYEAPSTLANNTLLSDILAASNGFKWMIRPRSNGMLVFYDGGTITDVSDDRYQVLNTFDGNGELPSMDIFSMAEDLDGEIWVGTGKGPAVFYAPDAMFSGGDFDAQQILIEQDGNVQILLETEAISALVVDGANRKWMGTQSSGAFLVSPDGTEQVLHFTLENSPLPSNNITAMAIDEESGEVFFGTDQGIVSYRGDATEGLLSSSCATVFPNPVRESYSGPIAIKGLVRDSDVKITDVAGNLVFRTTSLGGQAIWPGTDLSGNRVSTGVYLVFASDNDGQSKCNTKVLVVR